VTNRNGTFAWVLLITQALKFPYPKFSSVQYSIQKCPLLEDLYAKKITHCQLFVLETPCNGARICHKTHIFNSGLKDSKLKKSS